MGTTVTGTLIGHPAPTSVQVAAALVDLNGVERTGYVESESGQIRGPVTTTPDTAGAWSLDLIANSLIDTDYGTSLWRVTEGESGDFGQTASTYLSVPASGGPYWMGAIRTDPPGGAAAQSYAVLSVNGETGAVSLEAADVGAVPLSGDVVGGYRMKYKTADEQVDTSTTVQDDNHLSLTVAASGVYAFDGCLLFDSADANADLKLTFAGPSGSSGWWAPVAITLGNADGSGSARLTKFDLASESTVGAIAGGSLALPSGYVAVGATAGSLTLRWAQASSSATPTILRQGSWLRAHRVA